LPHPVDASRTVPAITAKLHGKGIDFFVVISLFLSMSVFSWGA
jgi:hypothetical protein